MNGSRTWLGELAALSASSPQVAELAPLEVGFEVGGVKMGLDLTRGYVTDGSSASCWVSGSEGMFAELLDGTLTLQRAHLTGQARLSGDPEGLLRLAFLFDAARALRNRAQGASGSCGAPVGAS